MLRLWYVPGMSDSGVTPPQFETVEYAFLATDSSPSNPQ